MAAIYLSQTVIYISRSLDGEVDARDNHLEEAVHEAKNGDEYDDEIVVLVQSVPGELG